MKKLAVYIHIPFCVRKCAYCDFISAPPEAGQINEYIAALKNEIRITVRSLMNDKDYVVDTVYIGGGTPSLIDAELIEDLLNTLKASFGEAVSNSYRPVEVTIECNPGTVVGSISSDRPFESSCNDEKIYNRFAIYRRTGINRISIGLQSANDKELAVLGRIHSVNDWQNTVQMARAAGFDNINTDLISGIPGQTWEDMRRSLDTVMSTGVEHISVYSLILEEGTPLYDRYYSNMITEEEQDKLDENDRLIYKNTGELLREYGYNRYEISNYSKSGYESRHNLVYWNRGDYVGFGLGAASMVDNIRYKNTDSYYEYISIYGDNMIYGQHITRDRDSLCGINSASLHGSIQDILNNKNDVERLSIDEQMSEFMFLGLRLTEGISEELFSLQYNTGIDDVYGDIIRYYTGIGMLIRENGRIRLSEEGLNVSNYIMADFIRE